MIEVSRRTLKNGKVRVTVEIAPGEKLMTIRDGAYYKMGYPFNEVVQSHIVEEATEVMWCPLGQEWVS